MTAPGSYQVIVSPAAYSDIEAIIDYIQPHSHQGAAKVIDLLWQSATSLRDFPTRHRIYQRATRARAETRVMPVGNYLMYYRIIDAHKVVRILKVRHGARRQPRSFE